MKKVFASMLAIALAATMAVPAFADPTELATSPATGKDAGDYTIGVDGAYVPGANAQEVISVDIAWDSMSFTYEQGKGEYSATDHKTTYPNAAWSTDKAGITVTNHSNTDITAAFSFAQADGVTTTGTFYQKSGDDYTKAETDAAKKLTLNSAEDTTADESPKDTLYFGVSGDAIDADKKLGTITVKIAGPDWKMFDSEETLKSALLAGGYVKLGANIDLSERLEITSAVSATLDLNGHTLTSPAGNEAICVYNKSCSLTVQDTAGGGKIVSDDTAIMVTLGTLHVKGGTLRSTGNYMIYLNTNTKATVSGGVISGGSVGVEAAPNSELTITGGTIRGNVFAVNANGIATISGGTLTGSNRALSSNTTSLTISGGTFNGNGGQNAQAAYIGSSVATITGGTFNGLVNCVCDLTISGGTFNYGVYNNGTKALAITGGTFNGNIQNDSTGTITITGGTFSVDPSNYVDKDNYTVTNSDGTYTVTATTSN